MRGRGQSNQDGEGWRGRGGRGRSGNRGGWRGQNEGRGRWPNEGSTRAQNQPTGHMGLNVPAQEANTTARAPQETNETQETTETKPRYTISQPLTAYTGTRLERFLTPLDSELFQRTIYIIDFETTLSVGSYHIPVEIAILAFTPEKGEISSFHKLIDPGNIPSW